MVTTKTLFKYYPIMEIFSLQYVRFHQLSKSGSGITIKLILKGTQTSNLTYARSIEHVRKVWFMILEVIIHEMDEIEAYCKFINFVQFSSQFLQLPQSLYKFKWSAFQRKWLCYFIFNDISINEVKHRDLLLLARAVSKRK